VQRRAPGGLLRQPGHVFCGPSTGQRGHHRGGPAVDGVPGGLQGRISADATPAAALSPDGRRRATLSPEEILMTRVVAVYERARQCKPIRQHSRQLRYGDRNPKEDWGA